jgi:hypothetical protein
MTRIAILSRDDMNDEQRAVIEACLRSPRGRTSVSY